MGNRLLFAIPLAVILGTLSMLHAYWELGGRWASAYTVPTVSGRRLFDPSPLATWVVCALLALAALLVLGALPVVLDLCIALVFFLRAIGNLRTFGFFKTLKGTPFSDWDTWLYSPLCLLIAFLAVGVARSPRVR